MKIKNLTVTNLRGLTQADFDFQDGMNLIVGINGVGKTTVLDAIRICLSRILPEITSSTSRKEAFEFSDINIMSQGLQVSCDILTGKGEFNILLKKNKEKFVEGQGDNSREQVIETPDTEVISKPLLDIFPEGKQAKQQPLAIYFSTRRSLFVDQKSSTAATGQAAAYVESLLVNRNSNLRVIAEWFRTQEVLAEEIPEAIRHIAAMRSAIETFMPRYDNLVVVQPDKTQPHFLIDKNGIPLNVRSQLSDGERGILALVLELAKRLSQANPELEDPLHGLGIVLIDELDLHLHPKWQRTIVENLQRTFPNCQFIATTHSPQIIGEVPPKHITVINNGTHNPALSYGLDSSSILEEILDSPARNKYIDGKLRELFGLIDDEKYVEAKELIKQLKNVLGSDNAEIRRSETMINFLEDDITDETDKEKQGA